MTETPGLSDVLAEVLQVARYALPLALSMIAFLDAARWDGWIWALSGRRRVLWMALIAFGVLSVWIGVLISGYYLLVVRRQLQAIDRGKID